LADNETVDEKFTNTFTMELASVLDIALLDVGEVTVEGAHIMVRVDDEHEIHIDVKALLIDRLPVKLRRPKAHKLRLVKS
jgi:hypothetical protein